MAAFSMPKIRLKEERKKSGEKKAKLLLATSLYYAIMTICLF
jgi:hypothetical protein